MGKFFVMKFMDFLTDMQRNNQYYNVNNLIEFEKLVLLRIISQQFGNPSGYVGEKYGIL